MSLALETANKHTVELEVIRLMYGNSERCR